ncbi:MAG: sugar ABC transporter permease, partial [Clostridia bacterium]|nr:sugar ABC transporter permease [Clostridia bacterium]
MAKPNLKNRLKKDYLGTLFILPVILGLILFTVTPMASSLWNSFHKIGILGNKTFIGLENYKAIFTTHRAEVFASLKITLGYTLIFIPLNMILSFGLALLLNQEIKGIGIFRVLCYAPVVIPTVVNGLLWQTVTASESGYLNLLLKQIGLKPMPFFESASTAFRTFIFVSMFSIGSGMII